MKICKQFSVVRGLILAASILASSAASAETYYWNKSGDNEGAYYKWSDPANWLVGDAKTAATTAPGEGDIIKRDNDQMTENMYIDLEGESISISGILFNSGSWGGDVIYIKNGDLTFTSEVSFSARGVIHLDDASMIFNGTSRFGHWNHGDDAKYQMDIALNGGSVLEINAATYLARVGFMVNEGAVLRFGSGVIWENANASKEVPININGGVLEMPNGHKPSGAWSYHPHVVLTSGQWNLGDEVKFANNIKFCTELVGGVFHATGNVKFTLHEDAWGKFNDGADVTLFADEGKTLDLSNFTYAGTAKVTLQGKGTIKLPVEGEPNVVVVKDGATYTVSTVAKEMSEAGVTTEDSAMTIAAKNVTIAKFLSNVGTFTIGAPGLTVGSAENAPLTGTFAIDASAFKEGDIVLVSDDEVLRTKVLADLLAANHNVVEEGNALKIGANELVFESTTIKDLTDPAGWRNGTVPPAGSSVVIAGEGVAVEVNGDLPAWDSITIANGAKLATKTAYEISKIVLTDGATLEVQDETTLTNGLAFKDDLESADGMAVVVVDAGATLKVPGGTKFKNVSFELYGSLLGLTDGPFVFGTANADETAYFTMTANGATITALNSAGTENGSRIDFAVPTVGGTVVVTESIVLTDTTFTYNNKDGFAFGLNNPSDQEFQVVADNTPLNIGAETTIAGGANLVLDNNSVLLRKRHSEGDTNDSKYNINVLKRGKITLKNGGEICAGVTRVNGNLVDGAIRVNPDEEGFVGIEILEGGVCSWYKANGYNKGTMRFAGGVFYNFATTWWSWGNRSHILNDFAAIELAEGTTAVIRGGKNTRLTTREEFGGFELESPFVGAGNLVFENTWSGETMEPNIICGNNTCTGVLKLLPDNGSAKLRLHFADGANWAGPVVWDSRMDLIVNHDYLTSSDPTPTKVTFAALISDGPQTFTFRLWGKEAEFKNDVVDLTGAGWGEELVLDFAVQNGYEVMSGDVWCLGTMPVGQELPKTSDLKWQLFTEPIDDDENHVRVFAQFGTLEYVFNSTDITDMNDPSAWNLKSVPKEDDAVSVAGVDVVAEMTADTPNFTAITVKDGAALNVSSARTLNPISLEAGSKLSVGVELKPISMTGFITKSEILLAKNVAPVDLSTLSYSATTLGTALPTSKPFDAAYVVKNADGSVTVQFQKADDVYTKAVLVKFELRDGSLYAKAIEGRYKSGTDKVGTDLSNGTTYAVAENATTKGYGAQNVTITAENAVYIKSVKVDSLTTFGEEGVVTIDIEEDNVLDLSEATIDAQAHIVKTGAGTILFDAMIPANLKIAEGSIGLLPDKEYDLSKVEIAEGVTYMAKTSTGVQPGYPVEKDGKVILKALGTFIGSGVWSDSANWAGGVIPGMGQTAFITQGSSAVIDVAIAALGSIEMEGETTITVLADATLPVLKLAPTAKVLIGDGENAVNVSLVTTPVTAFKVIDEEIVLPKFSVAANSILTVPGDTTFKNLDMRLYGTIHTEKSSGGVTFGYADADETTYFALYAEGATFDIRESGGNQKAWRYFVSPAKGGRVEVLGDIVLKNCLMPNSGWGDMQPFYVGYQNPTDIPFTFVLDGTKVSNSAYIRFGGAAAIKLINGAHIHRDYSCSGHWFPMNLEDVATVEVGEGCYFDYTAGDGHIDTGSSGDFTIRDGGIFSSVYTWGNGTGRLVSSNGVAAVGKLTHPNRKIENLFNGFASIDVAPASTFTIEAFSATGSGSAWARRVTVTDKPITGDGDVVISNGIPAEVFTVTMVNGANTCSGSIGVVKPIDGAAETKLIFADGANWAGTVVWNENMAITNLTDGAAATSVIFGNLKLASGELPIRLFRDASGALTSDEISLTGAIICDEGDTGVIRLVGAELENGDKVNLGTAPAGAWAKAVVKTATGRPVKIVESKPDEHGLVEATARIATGLMITIL